MTDMQSKSQEITNGNETTLSQVQTIIAESSGYEPADILPSFSLEDDLGLDMETDFPLIITKINRRFNIRLVAREVATEVETIEELVSLIDDEIDLG